MEVLLTCELPTHGKADEWVSARFENEACYDSYNFKHP